jgi:MFS family permease
MPTADSAAAHLRTIRSLMERATVYRAISGAAGLIGGSLALVVGGLLLGRRETWQASNLEFAAIWCAVLLVVTVCNFVMLQRGAARRKEPFISSGMKHAARATAPPLLAGFVLSMLVATTGPLVDHGGCALMVGLWTVCYGLALLATGSFSPRSMQVLGAAFFIMGLGLCQRALAGPPAEDYTLALRGMIGCFGMLHLFYGLWVVLSGIRVTQPVS